MPSLQPDRLQRFLARRRPIAIALWLLFFNLQAATHTLTAWLEVQRRGDDTLLWELLAWEFSSAWAWLSLIPLIVMALHRWPLHWGQLRAHLPRHLAASLGLSLLHVLLMVGLRKLVYAAHGFGYNFGHWPSELLYEALKDIWTYAFIGVIASAYRLLLWRLQGEASLLQRPDDEPAAAPAPSPSRDSAEQRPERFLVKKLGKEFLLPTREIEWVQACGNYVNLHRREHDYPLRSTLNAMEARLDERFVRVHRSYVVNLDMIDVIEPTEAGDARLRMKDGASVPCSRNHLEELRVRLQ